MIRHIIQIYYKHRESYQWKSRGIWIISSNQELLQPYKDVDIAADIKTEDWNGEDMEYGRAVKEISDIKSGGGGGGGGEKKENFIPGVV